MGEWDNLEVRPGLAPMEAKLVDAVPGGEGWQYEPKWDGFRCIAFRSGDSIELQSKSGKSLARYFPEIATALLALKQHKFVVDGELIIPVGDSLSFDALQMRLHPAESRIRRLSREAPARMMLFDCLVDAKGRSLLDVPLATRRGELESFHASADAAALRLSPYTEDASLAQNWLDQAGGALDGVVAKRRDGRYEPGERAMTKIKRLRSADCVVGGFRYGTRSREVGSLLLGLYNEQGLLDHVGFTSAIPADDKPELTKRLEALVGAPGFTGSAPGGPSRWSTDRSSDWQPVRPELVCEVRYDHVTGNRFRHGTKFLRWRPDKAPGQCRFDQLQREARPAELERALEGVK